MRLGLFSRLTLSIVAGVLVANMFAVGLALHFGLQRVEQQWEPRVRVTNNLLSQTLSALIEAGQSHRLEEAAGSYLQLAGVKSLQVSPLANVLNQSEPQIVIETQLKRSAPQWFTQSLDIEDRQVNTVLLSGDGQPLANLTLTLSKQPYANGLWDMLTRLVLVLSLGGAVLLFIAVALVRRNIRPLAALTAATKAVAGGDLTIRLKTTGVNSDIVPTIQAFNDMTDHIDHLVCALNERQSFLATIFNSSPIGIIQVDPDGRPLFANRSLLQFTGIKSENFEGEDLFRRIHPEDQNRVIDYWQSVKVSGKGDAISFRYVDKSNQFVWVTCNTVTMRSEDGSDSFIAFITDISTEVELRHQTQQISSFYLTLSRLNASIIHSRTKEELYKVVCDIFMREGGFAQALIATVDKQDDGSGVRAKVISLMPGNNVLNEMGEFELAQDSKPRSLIGHVILEDKLFVSNDYYNDDRFIDEFRERLYAVGIRSVSAVPIKCFGKTIAVLELFSRQTGFFTDQIVEHIVQAGENISHALVNFDREQQRQAALLAAKRSEQRLNITLRSIGDAVLVTDDKGCITMMNPVAETLTGWEEEDAKGKRASAIVNLINIESGLTIENPINQVLKHEDVISLEKTCALVARDGKRVPISNVGAPIRSTNDDTLEGAVLVFRDQSDEYHIQKALRESEQRYATLVKTLPVGIIVFDSENNTIYKNSELTRLIGVDADNKVLSLQDIQKTIHPDDFAALDKFIRKAVEKNTTSTTDYYRYLHTDGSVIWAKMRFTPTYDDKGRYNGLVGGVVDVTAERHHLQQIQILSTMYATLSRINYLVIKTANEHTLVSQMCETIADVANFDYVAYYRVNNQDQQYSLEQMARQGVEDFDDQLLHSVDRAELSAQELILGDNGEGQSKVINNAPGDDCLPLRWRKLAKSTGFHSSTLTPVYVGDEMTGVILILSRSKGLFSPNIVELLDEIGDVVSFALTKLESAEQKRQAELALVRNEERLRLGLTATHTGMLEINYVTHKVLLDETCIRLFKLDNARREYAIDEVKTFLPHDAWVMLELVFDEKKLVIDCCSTINFDIPMGEVGKQNSIRWLKMFGAVTAERTQDSRPVRLLGFLSDITEKKKQESRNKLAATVFSNSRESILILDAREHILMVNQAFCENYGYQQDQVLSQNSEILRSNRHSNEFYSEIKYALQNHGAWQGEWWRRRQNGQEYPAMAIISRVNDANDRSYHMVIQEIDISERMEAERKISALAYHDELTSLPNRTLLRDRVEQAIVNADREKHELALLFLDLDHFKNINDSLGHAFGDRLLQEISRRLQRSVRKSDTVGRLGGDEFLLLLPESCVDAAAHVAQKIIEECIAPCELDDHSLSVTPSIGVAMYPRDGADYDELLKKADTAMYRAKDEGRNGFRFFTPEMNDVVFERMMLESRLRKAIDKKEFLLHYQPKFAIDSLELVGVEALLRWQQPDRGMISPGQFIPVAEDTGLIIEIGQWVLQEACRQAKLWLDTFSRPIKVAINFSARQFAARSVEEHVVRVLDETGLPGELLEIEITESLLAQDMDYTYRVLNQLKERGIYISVDDFGTGYSSLSYLKRFPIDRLKIDQSFVRDLDRDQDDRAIAEAIITMGHSLGIRVIAEGIETLEQMKILQSMQCDEGQGYFLGQPMPAEELSELMRSHRLPAQVLNGR